MIMQILTSVFLTTVILVYFFKLESLTQLVNYQKKKKRLWPNCRTCSGLPFGFLYSQAFYGLPVTYMIEHVTYNCSQWKFDDRTSELDQTKTGTLKWLMQVKTKVRLNPKHTYFKNRSTLKFNQTTLKRLVCSKFLLPLELSRSNKYLPQSNFKSSSDGKTAYFKRKVQVCFAAINRFKKRPREPHKDLELVGTRGMSRDACIMASFLGRAKKYSILF